MEEKHKETFDTIKEDIESEETGFTTGKNYEVFTSNRSISVMELYQMWKNKKLILQADFQRGFVYNLKKVSKIVESILLGVPLPTVYLSEERGVYFVIDGQQRLTSILGFIEGKLPNAQGNWIGYFRLNGLEVLAKHNSKKLNDLDSEERATFENYKLSTIIFKSDSDSDLKFEIFERLNTGSVALNDQELRNCIYRGDYNNLLKSLSSDLDFRQIIGIVKPESRMRDVELVVRFAAFFHNGYQTYISPIKRFLNKEMESFREIGETEKDIISKAFRQSVALTKNIFGTNAFKRFYTGSRTDNKGYWEKFKINVSLFDIIMYSFATYNENDLLRNKDSIRELLIFLMTSDEKFIESIEKSTSSTKAVNARFEIWTNNLEKILNKCKETNIVFTMDNKLSSFKNNSKCEHCKENIELVDDAILNTINHYWVPGERINENTKFLHRYCYNLLRGGTNPPPSPQSKGFPRYIKIEEKTIYCKHANDVLFEVANFLISKGKIHRNNCPIYTPSGTRYLISTSPRQPNGKGFFNPANLKANLYLEKNWSSSDCLSHSKYLIDNYKHGDDFYVNFDVQE